MQLHTFSTSLKDARARADEIVNRLSANPEFARQIQSDRADIQKGEALLACSKTCLYTCDWTSLEAEK